MASRNNSAISGKEDDITNFKMIQISRGTYVPAMELLKAGMLAANKEVHDEYWLKIVPNHVMGPLTEVVMGRDGPIEQRVAKYRGEEGSFNYQFDKKELANLKST